MVWFVSSRFCVFKHRDESGRSQYDSFSDCLCDDIWYVLGVDVADASSYHLDLGREHCFGMLFEVRMNDG